MERERDALAEELGYITTLKHKLEVEAAQASSYLDKIAELENQQQVCTCVYVKMRMHSHIMHAYVI